jgi:DNA-binding winged helix-turn-helix (wHTH) protein
MRLPRDVEEGGRPEMTTLVLSAQERDELRLLLESALANFRREISRGGRHQHDEMLGQRRAILQGVLLQIEEARTRSVARRAELSARASEENTFSTGDLRVDLARRQVLLKARPVYLTPIEYRLLIALVKRAGQVLTHRELLEEVWDRLHAEQTHYLHVYVAHVRRKIEADPARPRYILTEPRVGYRLASE